jgi:MipA family protein
MRAGMSVVATSSAAIASLFLAIMPISAIAQDNMSTSSSSDRSAGPPANAGGRPQGGPPETIFDDTWVTVGAGLGYRPSYEGSDDYNLSPAPLIQGSVDGFSFGARGPGLFVDAIRDSGRVQGRERKIQFVLGPQILLRLDRTSRIKDPVVSLLGERDTAVEIGFTSGVAFKNVINPIDTLTLSLNAGWDVAGAHDGSMISPSISYSTPLSRAAFVNLSLSADRVDDNYAQTYYSIDAAGSAASGLPIYSADGGWKSAGAFMVAAYDLSGNALDGGFSLFGLASYNRLLGDAKRSPITSVRGSADQFFVGAGVAYSF